MITGNELPSALFEVNAIYSDEPKALGTVVNFTLPPDLLRQLRNLLIMYDLVPSTDASISAALAVCSRPHAR